MDLDQNVNLVPVLQVIHVTDMHVRHLSANPVSKLYQRGRFAARLTQYAIEHFDLFNWNDGTSRHYDKAPDAICAFLKQWREDDDRWYGEPYSDGAQTWLVDTGDRTAFGDDESLNAGREYIRKWREALGNCQYRSLFGNHDAWPEVLPAHVIIGLLPREIASQKQKIVGYPEWDTRAWLDDPLSISIPDTEAWGGSRIELYAFDTVCWNSVANTLALGQIASADLEKLRNALRSQWDKRASRHFRVVAMHHPLAFPFDWKEIHSLGILPSMRLWGSEACAHELRNDRDDPKGLGPLAHLFLSGHTHLCYPAGDLPGNVVDIHQGPLGPQQLQLVGGPLMLNRSARATRAKLRGEALHVERDKHLYAPAALDSGNCQAQILRFYSRLDDYGALVMTRTPVSSVDGSVYVDGKTTVVEMTYDMH